MYEVNSIITIKEERPLAWNVVFTVGQHEMNFATDIVYAARRNIWMANSFITHDISSLLNGKECPFCKGNKIACSVLCHRHEEIINSLIENTDFQNRVKDELPMIVNKSFPTKLCIETKKHVWDEVLYENFTSKLLLKQKKK